MRWGGRRAQRWTEAVLERYGRVCVLRLPGCTLVATTGDHIIPKSVRPDLMFAVENGRPACRPCNSKRHDGRNDAAPVVDNRAFFESAFTSGRLAHQSPPRESGEIGLIRLEGERT